MFSFTSLQIDDYLRLRLLKKLVRHFVKFILLQRRMGMLPRPVRNYLDLMPSYRLMLSLIVRPAGSRYRRLFYVFVTSRHGKNLFRTLLFIGSFFRRIGWNT